MFFNSYAEVPMILWYFFWWYSVPRFYVGKHTSTLGCWMKQYHINLMPYTSAIASTYCNHQTVKRKCFASWNICRFLWVAGNFFRMWREPKISYSSKGPRFFREQSYSEAPKNHWTLKMSARLLEVIQSPTVLGWIATVKNGLFYPTYYPPWN